MIKRSWRFSVALGLMLAATASGAIRAGQQAAPRDASITGLVVTSDETPQPVRRAIVALSGGDVYLDLNAITDDDGRFTLANIPPGRYTLRARRSGFVSIAYGALSPSRPGTPLVVERGQQLTNVRVRMARGAAIEGTVRNVDGEPVPGIEIHVERRERDGGLTEIQATMPQTTPLRTDDRGIYRVFGLAAGNYLVSAFPSQNPYGTILAPSDTEVDADLSALRNQNSAPGRPASAAEVPRLASQSYRLAQVFYPSSFGALDAVPVVVGVGDERRGIDITMFTVRTSTIDGRVSIPGGIPQGTAVSLIAPNALGAQNALVAADGTFRFPIVQPGRYTLTTTVVLDGLRAVALGGQPRVGAGVSGPCFFGATSLDVLGADISGVSLSLRPCARMRARVVFDGATTQPPADLTTVRVTVLQRGPKGLVPIRRGPVAVATDGSIDLGGAGELPYGAYQITVDVPGAAAGRGWWLRSAMADRQDILDTPLVVSEDSPASIAVVLTLSDRQTSILGRLQTPAGRPAPDYTVMAFTTNPAWWTLPYRRVLVQRPGTDGGFAFLSLPPGEYFLAALTDVQPDEWRDPEFLSQLAAVAVRVPVAEGEQKHQDFQIAVPGN